MTHTSKKALALLGITAGILGIYPLLEHNPQAKSEEEATLTGRVRELAYVQSNSLLPVTTPYTPPRIVSEMRVVVTAYSSTPEQTDDTPFITASGKWVRDGIVAANFLPMGTKIKFPDIYGDRVFVVEDRMHPSKKYQVDIWFPTYWEAVTFGVKSTHIEILES